MPQSLTFTRTLGILALVVLMAVVALPYRAAAHFSYSDPRIVHIAKTEDGQIAILVRMPAPLALLPEDWQGTSETRLPPFSRRDGENILLDLEATRAAQASFHDVLQSGLSVWLNGHSKNVVVGRTRFWPDAERPGFGTVKSARRSLSEPALPDEKLPYFDTTLDVEFLVAARDLDAAIVLGSQLGATFQVIDRFGTVIKLHRDGGTETQALIGVLDAAFPGVQSSWQRLVDIAWIGAEHIYLGFDHLAMILLIAIAARNWRQALLWASAFTAGHVVTLAAGLYGFAPQGAWFISSVEFLILASIIAAGAAIVLKIPHVMNWPALFAVGLVHGYGFASAASVALFAGEIDALALLAFAVGLELCQLAVYLAILPAIIVLDRTLISNALRWRQPVALCLAAAAGATVIQQLIQATGFAAA